jgi:predicted kinase
MGKKLIWQDVIFPPPEIDTYGLKVVLELREGETESWYKFDLPDGVQVLPFDENGKIIAIRQERNGVSYLALVGESMEFDEQNVFRKAVEGGRSLDVANAACLVAKRSLFEETGYEAKELKFLAAGLVNSGKGIPSHCFVLARGCRKVKESEKGIQVELWPPEEFFLALKAQFLAWPVVPKAGANSLIAAALGLPLEFSARNTSDEFCGTPTVVVLRGLPLSGKTTLGQELSRYLGWPFVDVDAIRKVAVGGETSRLNPYVSEELTRREGEDMRIAYQCMHEAVRVNITLGRSVICAATYSKRAAQKFLLDIVRAHPGARFKGIRCVFNDTTDEIQRRLRSMDTLGGCKTVEHYFIDKNIRHDYTDLWGVLEVNTSNPVYVCVAQALEFIKN